MSSWPNLPVANLIIFSTSAGLPTFATIDSAVPPALRISPATRVAPCSFRSTTTTAAPSAARRFAVASPIPEPEPEIKATLSLSLIANPSFDRLLQLSIYELRDYSADHRRYGKGDAIDRCKRLKTGPAI